MAKELKELIDEFLAQVPPPRALIRAKEAEIFQQFQLKEPILDLGCGDGSFAAITFDQPLTVGLDPLLNDLQEAKKRGIYEQTICASALQIPFPDQYFQTIISNCVLEHIFELERALGEINRVLKPGGEAFFTVISNNFNQWLLGRRLFGPLYTRFFNWHSHHYHTYDAEEWKKFFSKNNLKILKIIPYLDQTTIQFLDLLYYLSFPCLLNKTLFRRWLICPRLNRTLWRRPFFYLLNRPVKEGAALFFHCQKK